MVIVVTQVFIGFPQNLVDVFWQIMFIQFPRIDLVKHYVVKSSCHIC